MFLLVSASALAQTTLPLSMTTLQNGAATIREGKTGSSRTLVTTYTVSQLRSLRLSKNAALPTIVETTDFGGGRWRYDPADTSTPDNTGTCIVTANGGRFKRQYFRSIDVGWFISPGATDHRSALQAAFKVAKTEKALVYDTGMMTYNIKGPIVVNGDGIAGIALNGTISCQGAGYTALTFTGPLRMRTFRIDLEGNNNALNGIDIQFALITEFDNIRVHACNGFGLRIGRTYDSIYKNISVELCGNATNYAFSVVNGGDTSNMSHFLRLQVEQSREKAIYVAPETLGCVFHNIHSERQRVSRAGTDTWFLGGSTVTYANVRLQANTEGVFSSANAIARFYGTHLTVNDLRIENNCPLVLENWAEGLAQVVVNHINASGNVSRAGKGEVLIDKGYITTLLGATNRFYLRDVTINSVVVGSAPNENFPLTLTRCWVKNLSSAGELSYLKATDSQIDAGDFPKGACWLINSKFSFGTETAGYRRIYANNSTLVGNLTTDAGYVELSNNSSVVGNLTCGFARAIIFDASSYVTGVVKNYGPPESSTYSGGFSVGRRTFNPAPTATGVQYWVCTVPGVKGQPGTWTPISN
ncbi:hypothetical protein AWR27_06890 [Spirosoma montaniterrae]|uniref:Right handed beta helix domain-containing protein n=2 Tax=Spirosoma montaniterrae TaxID=1178516 RepID=A0A1P9WUQ1_9BACT|nr:hypothetical protein AWR27_06890 [Spirosoma montaniterrae]